MKRLAQSIILCSAFLSSLAFGQYSPESLYSAARSGKAEKLLAMITAETSVETLNAALGAAILGEQLDIMKILIDKGAQVDHLSSYNTPILTNAIMHGHFNAAKLLIDEGSNVNVKGYRKLQNGVFLEWHWTPLMCAAYKGNLELVEILIAKNAALNEAGWSATPQDSETAADIAAYSGHLDILKLLLSHNVSIGPEAIFRAARGGHVETIEFLLERGADINALSSSGKTLLMEASWWGHPELVKSLISRGADINMIGRNGYTALGEAVSNNDKDFTNQLEVVKILMERGADVNSAGPFKMTPLMRAVEADQSEIIDYLINQGAQ